MIYEIEFEGVSFFIENIMNEPLNMFYDRNIFICKYLKDNKDINIAKNLANVYINCKYLHCKYPQYVYQKIEKYL
jgi:hypothetical protein